MTVALAFALNKQHDVHEAGIRTASDLHAFAEIKDVLKKHGLEKKYGVSLLHKHFDLAEDEILVEYTDVENRILTSTPTKTNAVTGNCGLIETLWSLDNDLVMGVCVVFCHYSSSTGQHIGKHEYR